MQDLQIALIQSELTWENKIANLALFDQWFDQIQPGLDLIVLPEMFSTGFSMNAANLAEREEGETIEWLRRKASNHHAVVTGSFIAREGDKYFNRLVWMNPDGHYATYDKRHLFSLAKEHHYYAAGTERLVVSLKGWKVLPLICYDLRFPVWSRNDIDYDLLLYIANWPARRKHAWKTLLQARAIENQAYTIGLNRVGTDDNDIYYSGDSMLVDFAGEPITTAAHIPTILYATLSHQNQTQFRQKYRFLDDRDIFHIEGMS